jgi:flagellar motor protein MotB
MINLLNFFRMNNDMNVHIENKNDSGGAIINESQQTVEIQEEENQIPNDSPEVPAEDSKKEIERSILQLNDELSTIKQFLPIIQKEVESIKQYLIDADLQRVISISDTVNNIRLTSADISKDVKTILSKTSTTRLPFPVIGQIQKRIR